MEPEKKSNGAFIGLVIIVILLVVGGIYMWLQKNKQLEMQKTQNAALTTEDTNSANALEQDIANTDTNVGVDVNSVK